MRPHSARVALLFALGGLAAWLWLSRSGRVTAARAGASAASGAIAVTDAVRPLIEKALAWVTSKDSAGNLNRYWPALTLAADTFAVPVLVLARVAFIESAFRSDVLDKRTLGAAGEIGITQVIPKWHPTINLETVESQLYGTAKTLAAYAKQFGSWQAAVAAWNAGPGAVKKALSHGDAWRSKLPVSTQSYLNKLDQGISQGNA